MKKRLKEPSGLRNSHGLTTGKGTSDAGATSAAAKTAAWAAKGRVTSNRHCPTGYATTVASLVTSVQRVQNGDDGQSSRFRCATTARRKGTRLLIAPSHANSAIGGLIVPTRSVHTITRHLATPRLTVIYRSALRHVAALLLLCLLVVPFHVVDVAAVPEDARVTGLRATLPLRRSEIGRWQV
jgi:hypothetical protein